MFDKGYFIGLVNAVKEQQRKDILALIDLALDTKDKLWFTELVERLERVN